MTLLMILKTFYIFKFSHFPTLVSYLLVKPQAPLAEKELKIKSYFHFILTKV